jgi:hypothetical protein
MPVGVCIAVRQAELGSNGQPLQVQVGQMAIAVLDR